MAKFYVYPPSILFLINFLVIMFVSLIFVEHCNCMFDLICMVLGGFLSIYYIYVFFKTHNITEYKKRPKDINKLVKIGLYGFIRHPYYSGIIALNIAYFLYFRSAYLIPPILIFIYLWYLQAKYEDEVFEKKFGKKFLKYKEKVGMFIPK
jgi:protein-S-isoprenylcysteine O-methyltransferase Ste14